MVLLSLTKAKTAGSKPNVHHGTEIEISEVEKVEIIIMKDGFYAEAERNTKIFSIAQMASSIISFLSSLLILVIIFRSHKKLTTTINRLLLGLSISDMISSFARAFVTLPSPPTHELVWIDGIGNMALCRTQGALFTIGSTASPLYNCSICIYYLIEIKFTQNVTVMNRIERYLHAGPILISMIWCISLLAIDAMYPFFTHCFVSAYPFLCENDWTTNCEEGIEYKDVPALFIILIFFQIVIPVIIIGSMILIYREVAAQEVRMRRFSFTVRRSSRAVLNRIAARNRAIAYSAAYLLTAFWFFVMTMITLISEITSIPRWLSIVHYTFAPLQGFFNLTVFLQPRVSKYWIIHKRTARANDNNNNLMKVFSLALRDSILSRGSQIGRRSINTLPSPLGIGNTPVAENLNEEDEQQASAVVVLSSSSSSDSGPARGGEGQEGFQDSNEVANDSSTFPQLISPNGTNNNVSSLFNPTADETAGRGAAVWSKDDFEVSLTSFNGEERQNTPHDKMVTDQGG